MTAQQPDTYTHNKGSFWLGIVLGLLLIFTVFLVVVVLIG